ncbi:hypothetical protein GIB67_024349 [Kingdonia uniflora]|uniref:Histidine kinase domain-containing protein n=1 Tax=Kingdonia uniflora TaxID=39325 RepID=A0A7J7LF64_9MAGN|nr:hypothetical protein GIB67_024349 [Kingdonia uniflora]
MESGRSTGVPSTYQGVAQGMPTESTDTAQMLSGRARGRVELTGVKAYLAQNLNSNAKINVLDFDGKTDADGFIDWLNRVDKMLAFKKFTRLRVVKDSGCGVSAQELPHLFTKFSQSRSGPNQNHDSAGLGLALCKRFVNLMEGHIWIESDGLEKGSTVTMVVKLGICNSRNELSWQQFDPRAQLN